MGKWQDQRTSQFTLQISLILVPHATPWPLIRPFSDFNFLIPPPPPQLPHMQMYTCASVRALVQSLVDIQLPRRQDPTLNKYRNIETNLFGETKLTTALNFTSVIILNCIFSQILLYNIEHSYDTVNCIFRSGPVVKLLPVVKSRKRRVLLQGSAQRTK